MRWMLVTITLYLSGYHNNGTVSHQVNAMPTEEACHRAAEGFERAPLSQYPSKSNNQNLARYAYCVPY